jgi:hypothetical protein
MFSLVHGFSTFLFISVHRELENEKKKEEII